jgi:hypothetical protein
MDRQQLITVLESLANGIDPSTGARIPHDTFHSADTVRVLFVASSLLKGDGASTTRVTRSANPRLTSAGAPWSAEEDARLGHEFDSGMTVAQIALQHGRTSGAITSRLVKIGRMDLAAVKSHDRAARTVS